MAKKRLSTWLGALLGAILALMFSAYAHAQEFTEEFHHTYALTADGRIELHNINGAVHITGWDRNEVKIDAVKYAGTKERLDEARIEVEAQPDSISIRTKYTDQNLTFNDDWHKPGWS